MKGLFRVNPETRHQQARGSRRYGHTLRQMMRITKRVGRRRGRCYCTFQEDVSRIRYDAPNRQTLKSNSSGRTTSLLYRLGKAFEKIRDFSIFRIQIGSAAAYLSAKKRTRRLFLKSELFRENRGDGIATVRPHLVANRELRQTDRQTDRQNRPVTRSTSQYKGICDGTRVHAYNAFDVRYDQEGYGTRYSHNGAARRHISCGEGKADARGPG